MGFAKATPAPDRLPPHSTEAEMGVIGCILLDPAGCLNDCVEMFPDESVFYDLRHQEIYKAMRLMADSGKKIELITLMQHLKDKNMLEQVGGIAYLSQLQDFVPSSSNLPSYTEVVVEKSILRRLISTCTETASKVFDHKGDVEALIEAFEQKAMTIRPIKLAGADCMVKTTNEAIDDIERMFQSQGQISGISTGLRGLDRKTDGLHEAELTIIAAYPSCFKTSLAMNIAEQVCIDQGNPVGIFSLEMSRKELVKRMIATRARVNLREVAWGRMSEGDFPRMALASSQISTSKLVIDDTAGLTIGQIRAKARRMVQRHGIKLFVVDYIQLVSAPDSENRTNEIDAVSKGLKHMAKEFGVPVIALSQLNDDGKLKGARAIGEDADNVWVLEPNEKSNLIKLFIRKQRNGERNTSIDLTIEPEFTKFSDIKLESPDVPNWK